MLGLTQTITIAGSCFYVFKSFYNIEGDAYRHGKRADKICTKKGDYTLQESGGYSQLETEVKGRERLNVG